MKKIFLLLVVLFLPATILAQFAEQTSGTTQALYTVSAVDNSVVWVGGAGGVILRTTDGGTTWSNVGGGTIGTNPVYNIWAFDANTALCTTSPGTTFVYRTTDGGTTWTQVFTQAGGFIDAIWMTSATNGWMYGDPVGGRWSLWRTSDGGVTWDSTGLYLPTTNAGWNNAMFISGNNIWFGTNSTNIVYSSDNGATWSTQTATGQVNSYVIWFNNANTGLTGGTQFVATTNGGTNWGAITVPGTGTVSGITGWGNNWLVCRQATGLYWSTDNGGTWATAYTASAGNYYHIAKARNGENVWAVRSNGGITKGTFQVVPVELSSFSAVPSQGNVNLNWSTATETNNSGFEIQRKSGNTEFVTIGFVQGAGTTTEVKNYSYSDMGLQAGTYSYRLKQVDFDGSYSYSAVTEVNIELPSVYSLSQNYPNPFNPSTTITYSVPEAGNVRLSVYNLMGEEIASLVNGNVEAGVHTVSFDASGFASGTYFYRIDAGNYSAVRKMILNK
ncbi:MAG: YCF48-related protein [Ignavibacteriaceae bacterium]|nr:YCF48-related protein [Ignavibacteriaceae bacterium]